MQYSSQQLIRALKGMTDYDPAKLEPNPFRDWKIVFTITLVGLIVAGLFHAYLFTELRGAPLITESYRAQPLRRATVLAARMFVEEQERSYRELLATKPNPIDPAR